MATPQPDHVRTRPGAVRRRERRRAGRHRLRGRPVPVGDHPVLRVAHAPRRPGVPAAPAAGAGGAGAHRRPGRRGSAAGAGALPRGRGRARVPGPGRLQDHQRMSHLLPLLLPRVLRRQHRGAPHARQGAGRHRLHRAHPGDPRRARHRRRPAAVLGRAPGRPAGPAARHRARADHPHRFAHAVHAAATDHAGSVRGARPPSPALAEHPLQPPGRDHAGSRGGLRPPAAGRDSARQPDRTAEGGQRRSAGDAGARSPAAGDPRAALLHLPVPPRGGNRAPAHADRDRPGDRAGAARPHHRLRRAHLRARHPLRQGAPGPAVPAGPVGRRGGGAHLGRQDLAGAEPARRPVRRRTA